MRIMPLTNFDIRTCRFLISVFLWAGVLVESGLAEHPVDAPVFSHASGFYETPFDLTLSHPDPDVTILYTLDGSEPDPLRLDGVEYTYKNEYDGTNATPMLTRILRSYPYASPLAISDRSDEPYALATINTEKSKTTVEPVDNIFKATVVRARAFRDGAAPSPVVTRTYFVHPAMSNRYSLPLLSLVASEDNLFDYESGIYVHGGGRSEEPWWLAGNYRGRGDEWERPAHLEVLSPDGNSLLAQDMGVRIHGGASRAHRLKSLRLYARNLYESSTFEYEFFPGLAQRGRPGAPLSSFRRLLLRAAGQDWDRAYYRDAFMQDLVRHFPVDMQAARLVVHFINGEYWGLIHIRERLDGHYLAGHYDVPPEDVVILTGWRIEVDTGVPDDIAHFSNTVAYAESHDLGEPDHLSWILERVDTENLAYYYAARIYFNDRDWPQNNLDWWRKRTATYEPDAPPGHDGRWRWLLYDTDFGYQLDYYGPDANGLNRVVHPNPADTRMVSNKVNRLFYALVHENADFRHMFINIMADQLNSAWLPERALGLLDEYENRIGPYRAEHNNRWTLNTASQPVMFDFAAARPGYLRNQIVDVFDLPGMAQLTIDLADPDMGFVRVNRLDLTPATPGLPAGAGDLYPWTGIYFQGVPVTLEAVPSSGFRFVGWDGLTNQSPSATVMLTNDLDVAASFEPIPAEEQTKLLHEWDFEDEQRFMEPSFTVGGGAALDIEPGPTTEVVRNSPAQDFPSHHLRINEPLGATVTFHMPTKGYNGIQLSYQTRRSGQGAGIQKVSYTTNGAHWITLREYLVYDVAPQHWQFDFSDMPEVGDNMDFAVRIAFEQGAGGLAGNNRFDDVRLFGARIEPGNHPPEVLADIGPRRFVEGSDGEAIDLSGVFFDPDGDPLAFNAVSSNPEKVAAEIMGDDLILAPVERGEAVVSVFANDGHYAPPFVSFHVLVYPAAHDLAAGPYHFTEWDPDLPEGTYPPHMLFLQSEESDTSLDTPLEYAYSLRPEDYHANDQETIGFPYNNTGRTRINGLVAGGIAFINTGQERDLGGAVLALNTVGMTNGWVRWLGGTVLPNSRVYALRLQYRVGIEGEFMCVLDDAGIPIEYVRDTMAGHAQMMPPVALPDAALDQEYIQLIWRYYRVSGDIGPRAQLRLDEILVHDFGPHPVLTESQPVAGGSVAGAGYYVHEQFAELLADPAPYHHFYKWTGDVPPGAADHNPLWLQVVAPRTLTARFAADVTENTGTPHWWLAAYGLTNASFEEEALSIPEGGTLPAWKAYVADLDPTDPESQLPYLRVSLDDTGGAFSIDTTSTARQYAIEYTTNLHDGSWALYLPAESGSGAVWIRPWTNELLAPSIFFRGVILPPAD